MDGPRTVPTRVGPLAVRVVGEGTPAVLWHSLFVDERSWGRVEADLAEDRRLVLITGPGHGSSGDPGRRYTQEDCADAARTVLEALGVHEPVDWVGNAWGGHVGVVFAATWPDACRSLVTLGTPVQALTRSERARTRLLLLLDPAIGQRGPVADGVVTVLLSPRTRSQDPEAVELVHDCLRRARPAALRNAVVSISLRRDDLTALLPAVTAPTLFVTGRDHTGWTPSQAEAASTLLPRGSWAVIDGAAYLVPLEAPTETAALIRKFWASAPESRPTIGTRTDRVRAAGHGPDER